MTSITRVAEEFFDACETGKGWEACRAYCVPDATFSAQATPLNDVTTLAKYTDWMKGILTLFPDARYELIYHDWLLIDGKSVRKSRLVARFFGFSQGIGIALGGSRATRTLLPVAPTGVAMPPWGTAGFGNRDRFELNGKIGLHWAAG
jgi:hypothetical protein